MRVQRYRKQQKALHDTSNGNAEDVTQPSVTKRSEEERWRKVNERGYLTPVELREILQWGIDEGKIRARDDVALEYNLTQPEPRCGPAQLDKYELLTLLNNDIKLKKIDAPLYFLGAGEPSNHSGVRYSYSKDWYK